MFSFNIEMKHRKYPPVRRCREPSCTSVHFSSSLKALVAGNQPVSECSEFLLDVHVMEREHHILPKA